MKLFHISDLHLGKRVNDFSMLEDQEYILTTIINYIDEEKPDGILIAGDVYDKSIPSEEAVRLLDGFLTKLAKRKLPVYMISGNHDSATKLAFASKLIEESGVHIAPDYNGMVTPYALEREGVQVMIYMLPFVKPSMVRSALRGQLGDGVDQIHTYTEACKAAIDQMEINPNICNILIAHQFVTGASTCDSEEIVVGGIDNVDASVFDAFDYVALGHIHGPQSVGKETIRYSGTPLKYSFSEVTHHKSITVVDIGVDRQVRISTLPLTPLRDMRVIRGTYEELSLKDNYEGTNREDYIHAVLTDEEDVPEAMAKLRVIYPYIMKLTYDNQRTRKNQEMEDAVDVEHKSPMTLFEEFFALQNNQPMNDEQSAFMQEIIGNMFKEGN